MPTGRPRHGLVFSCFAGPLSRNGMHLVAIAWLYVVLMMAVAEGSSADGSVAGAVLTFVLYGVFPLSIVLYLLGTPGRRRARRAAETAEPLKDPAEPDAKTSAGTP